MFRHLAAEVTKWKAALYLLHEKAWDQFAVTDHLADNNDPRGRKLSTHCLVKKNTPSLGTIVSIVFLSVWRWPMTLSLPSGVLFNFKLLAFRGFLFFPRIIKNITLKGITLVEFEYTKQNLLNIWEYCIFNSVKETVP